MLGCYCDTSSPCDQLEWKDQTVVSEKGEKGGASSGEGAGGEMRVLEEEWRGEECWKRGRQKGGSIKSGEQEVEGNTKLEVVETTVLEVKKRQSNGGGREKGGGGKNSTGCGERCWRWGRKRWSG